jgi:hypothetical protein
VLNHLRSHDLADGGGTSPPGMTLRHLDAVTTEKGQTDRPAKMAHTVATAMTATASGQFAAVRYCRLS